MKIFFFNLLVLLVFSANVSAESKSETKENKKSGVIDLGEDESKSSLRQPNLRIVESQSTLNALLPEMYRRQFEATEERYLKPEPQEK